MAGRSLKKKRKSDFKLYPPMALKYSPLSYTKNYILISLLVASSVIIFFVLPSKTLNKLRFSPDSTQVYSAEVVNEFHHDPYAFTQVIPFVDFCILFSGFCGFFADLAI